MAQRTLHSRCVLNAFLLKRTFLYPSLLHISSSTHLETARERVCERDVRRHDSLPDFGELVHLVLLEFDLGAEQVDDRAAVRSDDRETLARRAPTRDLGELAADEASRDEAERASSDERVHERARLSGEYKSV